ncbi:hypothetical protein [Halalkalicoccus jeotgali]|uniref:hypothetical protein n=1 Tax=Halalkalicoccus jeotgali TaxID=413810 RepID=UPI000B14594F|nr:hypothetical protein [Halalkalicoccus jeotgali]
MEIRYERQFQLVAVVLLAVLGLIALGFAGVVSEATVRGVLVPASTVAVVVWLGAWLWSRFG